MEEKVWMECKESFKGDKTEDMEKTWEAVDMRWLGNSVPRTSLSTPVTSGFLMTHEQDFLERAGSLITSLLWYQQLSWFHILSTTLSCKYSLLIKASLPQHLLDTRFREPATWHVFTASVKRSFLFDYE